MIDFVSWKTEKKDYQTILSFDGDIDDTIIQDAFEITEKNFDNHSIPTNIRKKIFGVVVESLQNLYHHLDAPPSSANKGKKWAAFILSKSENSFQIKTKNFLDINNHLPLRMRMEQINTLEKDDLKSLYKLILSNQKFSEKGGGGLGLVEMVRRSGNKIDYEFEKYDNNFLLLYLFIQVNLF